MEFSAQQLARFLGGSLEGDPLILVNALGKIEEAGEGSVSFISNPKYEEYLYTTRASIVIVNEGLRVNGSVFPALIRVRDAYSAWANLLEKFNGRDQAPTGIDPRSFVHPSARIGNDVYIGAFAYVGEDSVIGDQTRLHPGVIIGDKVILKNQTTLHPGVVIYHSCMVGNRVIIHANTVIGGDGFGFAPQKDGSYKKIPQIGNVVIEDDVEIGACTTIDRATLGSTIIRSGVKLDNLIQIAHNVEIGENTAIAALTGISGSSKVGKNCVIGGQVGLVGHIQIADGTRIGGQSGISKSVHDPNTSLMGSPAFDYKSSLKSQAIFRNLPDLEKRLVELEEMVRHLLAERERV